MKLGLLLRSQAVRCLPLLGVLLLAAGCRKEPEKPLEKRTRVLKPLALELRAPRSAMESRLVGKKTEQEEDEALLEIGRKDLPKISAAATNLANAAAELKNERAQKSSADYLGDVESSARSVARDCATLDSIPQCRTALASLDMVLARDPALAKLAQPLPAQ